MKSSYYLFIKIVFSDKIFILNSSAERKLLFRREEPGRNKYKLLILLPITLIHPRWEMELSSFRSGTKQMVDIKMPNIFTYGSLMFQPVWSKVVKGEYGSMTGKIYGVQRKCVRGETYPCLIGADNDQSVEGTVYFQVSREDAGRLDLFEGEYYRRCRKKCVLADGRLIDVETYLFRKEFYHLADDKDWDVKWFESEGIYYFINYYKGFSGGNHL